MGNSTGNMKEFWDIFRSTKRIIGGCIWDFKDQGISRKDSMGKEYYAYGGDFGEKFHDGNFCLNGIAASEGRPKAAMYECKRIYQPVECMLADSGKGLIKVTNRHAVKSLSGYSIRLKLKEDGKIISEKQLTSLQLEASKDTIISIRKFLPALKPGREYLADISFTLTEDLLWAEKGHEVAGNQFALTGLATSYSSPKTYPTIISEETDSLHILKGNGFQIAFDKTNGGLSSYLLKGQEQILSPLSPHFTRPQTDNDRKGWKPKKKLKEWYEAQPVLKDLSIDQAPGVVKVRSKYSIIEGKANAEVVYTVNGDGVIKVDYTLTASKNLPNLPKVGMQCGIQKSDTLINWYGRGLYENYIDRRYGFDAGIYSQSLSDFLEPYVYPQENGNRTDVRWMFLSNSKNKGLLVIADSLLSMSAWPYTEKEIEEARHHHLLKESNCITLNIDLIQMGVGGNDSWSDVAQPLDKYQVAAGYYRYSFYLKPLVVKKENIIDVVRKSKF
jgi:beta-galactosidase